jgi:hypothetical protein
MKYAAVMTTDSMIYIPRFKRICSGILKSLDGIHIQTHTEQGDLRTQFNFFSS